MVKLFMGNYGEDVQSIAMKSTEDKVKDFIPWAVKQKCCYFSEICKAR